MNRYVLYGAEVSYFSAKARAYLRWRGADFEERLATRDVYRSVILPKVGWPVIPVLEMPGGEIVQDTADIIDRIEAAEALDPPALPSGALQRLASRLIELYADEWMVLPAMHYRWNYNEDWAYREFGAISAPDVPPQEQYAIGRKTGEPFKASVAMLGVSDATIPGIEAAYEGFLRDMTAHLARHEFLLGARASLGDFALNGPLYAHLLRDPESGRLMERLAPKVADYVRRVQAGAAGSGDLLADDGIPATLSPIFARQMTEQMPALVETAALLGKWAEGMTPGTDLPRGLGTIDFEIGGFDGSCAARTFPLWRYQAVTDVIDTMNAEEKGRAEAWLDTVGGAPLMTFRLPARIARKDFRLKLAVPG